MRRTIHQAVDQSIVRETLFRLICEHLGEKTFLNDTFGQLDCMKKLAAKYTVFGKPSCPEEMLLKLEIADGISL